MYYIPKVGVENRGTQKLVHDDTQKGSTRYWNYLENYWPCAGGLPAVNTIGTQLRDPTKLGADPMSADGIDGRCREKLEDFRG